MSWICQRHLASPWPSLPCRTVAVPSAVSIQLKLASSPVAAMNPVTEWLTDCSGDSTLRLEQENLRWQPESLPAPWHKWELGTDPAQLELALKAELLFSLRLLPRKSLGQSPYRADEPVNRFMKRPDQRSLMREGIFFAFLDQPGLFVGNGIMNSWLQAARQVIFERGPLAHSRNTGSSLIQLGFRLLTALTALRAACGNQEQMEQLWARFVGESADDLPATCAAVYWGEAVYRLSELNDMQAANALLARQKAALTTLAERLPGLDADDLVAGMWHHHFGRLAYYRGDMEAALDHYGKEWHQPRNLDETNRSRLCRSCASVLTDIGYLAAAEGLTKQAIKIQEHADEPELFKSYGRLAENLARQGRYHEARAAFETSWQLQQQRLPKNTEPDAQTAVYLGHIHVLLQNFAAAESHYDDAELYSDKRFNPYLSMGRAAWFYRTGQLQQLADLWAQTHNELTAQRGEKVLPVAVINLARYLAGHSERDGLLPTLAALKAENYWLEACFLLPYLFPSYKPAEAVDQEIQDIKPKLERWQVKAEAFCRQLPTGPLTHPQNYFSLPDLLADLNKAMVNRSWDNCVFLQRIYPFKLLLSTKLD